MENQEHFRSKEIILFENNLKQNLFINLNFCLESIKPQSDNVLI